MKLLLTLLLSLAFSKGTSGQHWRNHKHRKYDKHHQYHDHNENYGDHGGDRDECLQAVRGTGGSITKEGRLSDCSRFLAPAAASITTKTLTITSTLTEPADYAAYAARNCHPHLGNRIPNYALKACHYDPARYRSACSRLGVTTGTCIESMHTLTTTVTTYVTDSLFPNSVEAQATDTYDTASYTESLYTSYIDFMSETSVADVIMPTLSPTASESIPLSEFLEPTISTVHLSETELVQTRLEFSAATDLPSDTLTEVPQSISSLIGTPVQESAQDFPTRSSETDPSADPTNSSTSENQETLSATSFDIPSPTASTIEMSTFGLTPSISAGTTSSSSEALIGPFSTFIIDPTTPSTPTQPPNPPHIPPSPLIQNCTSPQICTLSSTCSSPNSSTCLCQPSVSGTGYCLADTPCSSLTDCSLDSDCGDGSACMRTCCRSNKCLSLPFLCANPGDPGRLFEKRDMGGEGEDTERVVRRGKEGENVLEEWTGHILLERERERGGKSSADVWME